MGIKAHF